MDYNQDHPQAFDGAGPAHQVGPDPNQVLQQQVQQGQQHAQQIGHQGHEIAQLQQAMHALHNAFQNAQPAQQAGNVPNPQVPHPQPQVGADAGGGPALDRVQPFASVKVESVPVFTGENARVNARLWLSQVRLYMDCLTQGAFQHDAQRIQYVGTRLGGYAASWFNKYWYSADGEVNRKKPFDALGGGDSFTRDFHAQFQPVGGDRTARVELLMLQCPHSRQYPFYHKKFLELLSETQGMAEADQVTQFIRGLPSDMSKWILMQNPQTLNAAMQSASLFVQNEITHRKTGGGQGQGGTPNKRGGFGRPGFGGQRQFQRYGGSGSSMYSRPVPSGPTYDGPAPMELGQRLLPPGADRRYRVGPKERAPGETNKSQCYNCGKFGHWVQNCDKQLDDARIRANRDRMRRARGRGSVQFQCREVPASSSHHPTGSYASGQGMNGDDWSMEDGQDRYFDVEER